MRRSPLRRRTPLKRTPMKRTAAGLPTRSRLKPVSAKRRRRDASYPAQREAAYRRAEGRCEAYVHVGGCTGRAEQVHHIAGRGGSDPHRLSNLLGVCGPCHHFIHVEPAAAYRAGLMVRKHRDKGDAA